MSETKIKIDGTEYEIPNKDSLTLGEARLVERYCEGHSEGDGYGLAKFCGLIHVAIKRVRPDASFEEINARIDSLGLAELEAQLPAEDDAGPPEQEPAGNDLDVSAPSSTETSSPPSEPSPESESPTGTGDPGSDTGAPSVRRISAA